MAHDGSDRLFDFPIYREDLPPSGRDLVDLIGWPKTRTLIQSLGGVIYPIPKGRDNNSQGSARYEHLVELIGTEAADVLLHHYSDSHLYIPTCRRAVSNALKRHMQARCDQGASLEQIAIELHVTTRWVSMCLTAPLAPVGEPLE